ncbi:MAG: BolA family protein [Burkholderiaceae bacterium]
MTAAADTRVERIRERLCATLSPLECQVTDDSALHVGHPGAASGGGHYTVRLVADCFEGQNRLARHRLVYHYLDDMMRSEIHALAVIALAPSEAQD